MVLVVRNFLEHRSLLRASALSFTTILSIVPLLALAFAILKGLGVQNSLEPLILQRFTVGSGEVVDKIVTYINNTKMGSVGAIGLVFLVVTVISLLGNIEEAFNDIWGVEEARSTYRRFSDYLSVVVSGPMLLLAAMSITTSLQSQSVVLWILQRSYFGDMFLLMFQVVPYLSIWIALVCLYIFMPNTKVRLKSALVGGILAGTALAAGPVGIHSFPDRRCQVQCHLRHPRGAAGFYGLDLYQLGYRPVRCGGGCRSPEQENFSARLRSGRAELCYPGSNGSGDPSDGGRVILPGGASLDAERLADERHVPLRTVRKLLAKLVAAGYLLLPRGRVPTILPVIWSMSESGTLIRDLKHQGGEIPFAESDQLGEMTRELILKLDRLTDEALADLTLKDLVERCE